MPTGPSTRVQNKLLSGLRRSDRLALVRCCEPVDLLFGQILCQTDEPFEHAHFPLTGFVSLLATAGDLPPLEIGLIGNEGMLGATLSLGVDTAPMRGVVQGGGCARSALVHRILRPLITRSSTTTIAITSSPCRGSHRQDSQQAGRGEQRKAGGQAHADGPSLVPV